MYVKVLKAKVKICAEVSDNRLLRYGENQLVDIVEKETKRWNELVKLKPIISGAAYIVPRPHQLRGTESSGDESGTSRLLELIELHRSEASYTLLFLSNTFIGGWIDRSIRNTSLGAS